ncbi:MAG: hypothetical protein DDT19_01517 [Syntrophomonadaceae bacterium]|nr:hypothetical protein [Bacillota bacterium]
MRSKKEVAPLETEPRCREKTLQEVLSLCPFYRKDVEKTMKNIGNTITECNRWKEVLKLGTPRVQAGSSLLAATLAYETMAGRVHDLGLALNEALRRSINPVAAVVVKAQLEMMLPVVGQMQRANALHEALRRMVAAVVVKAQFEMMPLFQVQQQIARSALMTKRLVEHWRRLEEWPHIAVLVAFKDNDTEAIDEYLRDCCGVKTVAPSMYAILWEILRSGGWRCADNPAVYIRAAFWRQYKKTGEKSLLGKPGRVNIETDRWGNPAARHCSKLYVLQTSEPGFAAVESKDLVEWALSKIKKPKYRQALLRYCAGGAETLLDTFGGDKNAVDMARRYLRKRGHKLKTHLL